MTMLDTREPAVPARPPRSPAVQRRTRRALTGLLALSALGAGTGATTVLVGTAGTSDISATGTSTAVPAAATGSGAAPAPVAPASGAEVVVADVLPAAPVEPAAEEPAGPEDAPALVDAAGAPLAPDAAEGVRAVFDALARGDLTALEAAYAPRAGSAPWPAVDEMLQDPAVRTGLQDALRDPPGTRPDLAHLYDRDGFRVAVDDDGRVRFFRAPARADAG